MTAIESILTGIFTGLGSAIGTYLATRTFIKNFERIEKKLKDLGNSKEKKTVNGNDIKQSQIHS